MPENHSAEFYRGALSVLEGRPCTAEYYRALLAEAEAAEAGEPTAEEVVEAAEKALGSLHKAAMDLRCATAIPSVTSAVIWHNAHQAVMADLVVAESALALIARYKEAHGGTNTRT